MALHDDLVADATNGPYIDFTARAALLDRGVRPPCSTATDAQNDWISENPDERARAATKCWGCPLTDLCRAMAEDTNTSHGVFGGHDYSKSTRNSNKEKTA